MRTTVTCAYAHLQTIIRWLYMFPKAALEAAFFKANGNKRKLMGQVPGSIDDPCELGCEYSVGPQLSSALLIRFLAIRSQIGRGGCIQAPHVTSGT